MVTAFPVKCSSALACLSNTKVYRLQRKRWVTSAQHFTRLSRAFFLSRINKEIVFDPVSVLEVMFDPGVWQDDIQSCVQVLRSRGLKSRRPGDTARPRSQNVCLDRWWINAIWPPGSPGTPGPVHNRTDTAPETQIHSPYVKTLN